VTRAHHGPLARLVTMVLLVAYTTAVVDVGGAALGNELTVVVGVAVAIRLLVSATRTVLHANRQPSSARLSGSKPVAMRRRPVALPAVEPDNGSARSGRMTVDPEAIGCALARLDEVRDRLARVPRVGQIRTMAWFDGKEPCSYLLDERVNFVPEPVDASHQEKLDRYALCFTCHDPQGLMRELVITSDGTGFDLLGDRRWTGLLDG